LKALRWLRRTRFAGYYGTDGDFKERVSWPMPAKIKMFKEHIIRVPRTVLADASTTTYLRKQPEDKPMIIQDHRLSAQQGKRLEAVARAVPIRACLSNRGQ
jgi:hypothetical protein